jgi:hypothetical protein
VRERERERERERKNYEGCKRGKKKEEGKTYRFLSP